MIYIRHRHTGKRYLLIREFIFQRTITYHDPYRVEILPDTRNGEPYVEYQPLHPTTGKPWQATRTGLAVMFEKEPKP